MMSDEQTKTELDAAAQAALEAQQEEKEFIEAFGADTEKSEPAPAEKKAEPIEKAVEPGEGDGSVAAEAAKAETAKAEEAKSEPDKEIEEPDDLEQLENRLHTRMRNLEGHLGGIKSQLQAMQQAKSETKSDGAAAPTKEQIQEAAGSSEKLDALRDDFPEWADALDEQLSLVEGRVLKKVPQLDTDDLLSKFSESTDEVVGTAMERAVAMARQLARVDIKHPGWEATVATEQFQRWKEGQNEEIQALAESDSADDAINMLDMYKESVKAKEAKEKSTKRLESAVAPTRSAARAPREVVPTDEEDFERAFYE